MEGVIIKDSIPDSVLPFPEGLWNQVKYVFWKIITPGYTWGRDFLLRAGFIHHAGRQNYVLGRIAPGVKIEAFLKYLLTQRFANHFIAWKDDDEAVSLRKLVSFEWQYHLRIFKDGEVRGHFEYTPEAHPRLHLKEIGMEERRHEFLNFLGDWIVPSAKK